MKLQFQFAGVNLDRPVPQHQRRKRWVVFGALLVFLGLCYWQYLHYLSHGSFFFIQIRKPMPVAAAQPAVAPKPTEAPAVAPVAEKKSAEPTPATDETMTASWSKVAEAVKMPALPTSQPASVAAVAVAPIIVSVVDSSAAVALRTPQPKSVETPEQRLQRAGQKAFDTMLGQANKNPDAYGFLANDIFTETTLGEAIPVYTITEKDRAAYQAGQPVEELLKPARQWVFPVYAGSRLCCMVQVSYNGHEYIPGNATKFLAMAWNKIAERWPVEDGYHPRLVINPDISGYYFTIPELPEPNITDTFQMFALHPSLSPADVILASWR